MLDTNNITLFPLKEEEPSQSQLINNFEELQAHSNLDAAALALGNLWLTLFPDDRKAVSDLLIEKAGGMSGIYGEINRRMERIGAVMAFLLERLPDDDR